MNADDLKRAAAARAVGIVADGMTLGLGTGSTAAHVVTLLGERVRAGLRIVGVPTSEGTARAAAAAGIPLTTLDDRPALDLTIDGADELDGALRLIKGGGGALLREKIVAAASAAMIVVADASKRVAELGTFPLPVEVVPFGLGATRRHLDAAIRRAGCEGPLTLRQAGETPFLTDGGHLILDAHLGRIPDPEALAAALATVPGVVEHGLFIGLATGALVASADGVREFGAVRP